MAEPATPGLSASDRVGRMGCERLTREQLAALRRRLGETQAGMAARMGVSFRCYQAIERGQNPVRPIHVRAATLVALEVAAERRDLALLPPGLVASLSRLAAAIDCA